MRVGFIGAGRMGRPMLARLVQAGHHVSALGRTAEKRHSAMLSAIPSRSALVVHTAASPSTVETIAAQAAAYSVDVVDAPVSGGIAKDLGSDLGVLDDAIGVIGEAVNKAGKV